MLVIGHRGTAGTAPENTLASFEDAIRAGVKMIELDVHRCASGELVVIHDEKINRTTDGKGRVAKKTLSQLQQFDAGEGEVIPTLRQVLHLVHHRVKVNIELKGPDVAEPVFHLLKDNKRDFGWKTKDFYISSFDHKQLIDFRQLDKETRIGILYSRNPENFIPMAQEISAFSINLPLQAVNEKTVNKIHAARLQVWVYTVNKIDDMLRMKQLGVDAVFTNFPQKLLEFV